jgi:putative PIN family toxin of toxin-antitoxin system
MISAVFDTTTLLQAATSRKGPAAACLAYVDDGQVKLFISTVTLDEIREVLSRPNIRKSFSKKLTDENVLDFLDHLVDKGHMIEDVPRVYKYKRDPDDEPFLDLAIATQASFIVSRDNDLLDLMQDDEFRKAYPALAIVDPPSFLAHVRAEIAKDSGKVGGDAGK